MSRGVSESKMEASSLSSTLRQVVEMQTDDDDNDEGEEEADVEIRFGSSTARPHLKRTDDEDCDDDDDDDDDNGDKMTPRKRNWCIPPQLRTCRNPFFYACLLVPIRRGRANHCRPYAVR